MRSRALCRSVFRSSHYSGVASIHLSARRSIQITATPTTESNILSGDVFGDPIDASAEFPDARFEVLGAPYSLLSVSLSASQRLHTQRGTLVGLSGKAENVQSTLSLLEPFRRALLGIPFLYQKITSATPITALISTKSPLTTFVIVHLDGTTDWMITQRKALSAWTGHTLKVSPTFNRGMSLAHLGCNKITGRGLMALAGPGRTYQISLKAGETYVAHPGNVVAYTITNNPPMPYRFKSSTIRLQVPKLKIPILLNDIKFFRVMQKTDTWKGLGKLLFNLRTAARRTIWGDRLFLQFHGPTNILISSRASRINDVLTSRDVNEIADSPPGEVSSIITLTERTGEGVEQTQSANKPTAFNMAEVGRDGKVSFEAPESHDLKR